MRFVRLASRGGPPRYLYFSAGWIFGFESRMTLLANIGGSRRLRSFGSSFELPHPGFLTGGREGGRKRGEGGLPRKKICKDSFFSFSFLFSIPEGGASGEGFFFLLTAKSDSIQNGE